MAVSVYSVCVTASKAVSSGVNAEVIFCSIVITVLEATHCLHIRGRPSTDWRCQSNVLPVLCNTMSVSLRMTISHTALVRSREYASPMVLQDDARRRRVAVKLRKDASAGGAGELQPRHLARPPLGGCLPFLRPDAVV